MFIFDKKTIIMNLNNIEIHSLVDKIKNHVIDMLNQLEYTICYGEYLYNGKKYWYKAIFYDTEYIDVHELSVENKEGDLEIIF